MGSKYKNINNLGERPLGFRASFPPTPRKAGRFHSASRAGAPPGGSFRAGSAQRARGRTEGSVGRSGDSWAHSERRARPPGGCDLVI